MEIERKFLIDWKEIDALGLPLVKQAQSWQLASVSLILQVRQLTMLLAGQPMTVTPPT